MTRRAARRLLLVHAHPDDETITTGGTIARYVRAGVEVTVLTCTLGEEGEVVGSQWSELAAGRADQLGGYRILELSRALSALGVAGPWFLGSAGRWRDSGMIGTPSAENPRAFVNAHHNDAVGAVVSVIRELRPQVVVTYDPVGGYGHPDHIQAHRITTDAVAAAGADGYPNAGTPWAPSKFYWTVAERESTDRAVARLGAIPDGWRKPQAGELPGVAAASVTTTVDISALLDVKRAALRAHATQLTVAPSGTQFALTNNVTQPLQAAEHFILVGGAPGPTGVDGREDDLFAGLAE